MNTKETLIKAYKVLDNETKLIAQIFAVCVEPILPSDAAKIATDLSLRNNGKIISQKLMKESCNQLEKLGLIKKDINRYSDKLRCEDLVLNFIMGDAYRAGLAIDIISLSPQKLYYSSEPYLHLRALKIAFLQKHTDGIEKGFTYFIENNQEDWLSKNVFLDLIDFSTAEKSLINLPIMAQLKYLTEYFDDISTNDKSFAQLDVFLKNNENGAFEPIKSLLDYFRAHILFMQGNLNGALALLKNANQIEAIGLMASILFLRGDTDTAISLFENGLKAFRKQAGIKKFYFQGIAGVMYILALLKKNNVECYKKIESIYKLGIKEFSLFSKCYYILEYVYLLKTSANVQLITLKAIASDNYISELLKHYVMLWTDTPMPNETQSKLKLGLKNCQENQFIWYASEFAQLLNTVFNADEARKYEHLNIISFNSVFPKEEEWAKKLKALELLGTKPKAKSSSNDELENAARLIWLVDFKAKTLEPIEQKYSKGKWSAGRKVALKRIKERTVESMTPQDTKLSTALFLQEGWYNSHEYYFDFDKGILLLAGHPFVFLAEKMIPCEIVRTELEIIIEQKGSNYELKLSMPISAAGTLIKQETPTRYQVTEITEKYERIAGIIGKTKLVVPANAKDALVNAISSLGGTITIHSPIGEAGKEVKKVTSSQKIHVHLLPYSEGFKAFLLVKPFDTEPPYVKPGIGNTTIYTNIKGEKIQTSRNLKTEIENAKLVIKSSPYLTNADDDTYEWVFDEPESCLNVLLDLDSIKDQITIEWPEGEKLKMVGKASFANLKVSVKQSNDWFDVQGELRTDDGVISMQLLLQLLQDAKGKFIQLDGGKFLALTDEFRKRLKDLQAYTETTKDGLKFHNLASFAFDDFAEELDNFKADKKWKEHIERIKSAKNIKPEVPTTFQADLRDYQKEGFLWLSRLAEWGVGACLADDMGLGKTIQALALMLNRAEKGAALVVAPASVTRNWQLETKKFAPTLNPIILSGTNKEREATIKNLKPFDVLLCSYGLLQQDIDFSEITFATVVLDEAQYIKNTNTKRSKAAMELKADFKIITTGTPVENHLGELWNLFRFINPGLLGSLDKFNEKFAIPIEKNNDKDRRKQLQKVIQPFILRRKKNQVLDELPSKTEITLEVEMSNEEMMMYEALRMNAIQKITEVSGDENNKRFQILAEITKLRRMCCNPKLVLPESPIQSSKLNLLSELVDELVANGHKALIFSQFVGHLAIIKDEMEKKGVSYQYLDGSTTQKKRQEAINDFQKGLGDVFLISLKAGGVGLNLTAADYVIHTDPWWNPAVEDQASDRAHRMGQQRPVTIYRLVTKGTIEDKIVFLHKDKRELADSLLEGTEMSGKLDTNQLLTLIKDI